MYKAFVGKFLEFKPSRGIGIYIKRFEPFITLKSLKKTFNKFFTNEIFVNLGAVWL